MIKQSALFIIQVAQKIIIEKTLPVFFFGKVQTHGYIVFRIMSTLDKIVSEAYGSYSKQYLIF